MSSSPSFAVWEVRRFRLSKAIDQESGVMCGYTGTGNEPMTYTIIDKRFVVVLMLIFGGGIELDVPDEHPSIPKFRSLPTKHC
jgi:hypothetical protein